MRFVHMSDSHLGKRLLGLYECEEDYYRLFNKTIDRIIELDVDFVIHSGDLFDQSKPTTNSLLAFQDGLIKLNNAGIPIYAIAGNHDLVFRKNMMPPLVLFRQLGLKIISPRNFAYTEGDILICGVQYHASSQKNKLMKDIARLSQLAEKYPKSILVLHQGIKKFLPEEVGEFEISDLPDNFDYYAMGHLHNYISEDMGNGKLVYPGSMGIFESYEDFSRADKGICLVDMSGDKPTVERIKIDYPRAWIEKTVRYENLSEELDSLASELKTLDEKPLLELTVRGGDFESSEIYEYITDRLGDCVFNMRPSFKPNKVLLEDEIGNINEPLDPKSLLIKRVDELYEDKDLTGLSVDLFETLAKKDIEGAKDIAEEFFIQHCFKEENKEKSLDDF